MKPLFPSLDRERLLQVFFFAAFAWVGYQLFLLSRPFLPGLLSAVMLAMAFAPLRKWLRRYVKNRTAIAAIMCLGVLLVVILPLIGIVNIVIHESGRLLPVVRELLADVQNHDYMAFKERIPLPIQSTFLKLSDFLQKVNIDLKYMVLENAGRVGTFFSSGGLFLARHALFALFNGLVMMLLLFFAFRDGEVYAQKIISIIPLRTEHKEALAARVYETFRAVTIGVFATAAAQGFAATLGFWMAGVRLPLLLGAATGFVSLLGASFLITVPVALTMFSQSTSWGIFLLIWGMGIVGLMDNFLKPILIGSRTRMPFVLIFFSILGGVKMYGLLGILLGPILVASFLTFVKIYQEEYRA